MTNIKMGLTIEEAAEMSGIGRNTMRKLVDWGKLPVLKVGRKTIIRRDALENFMTVNQGRNLLNQADVREVRYPDVQAFKRTYDDATALVEQYNRDLAAWERQVHGGQQPQQKPPEKESIRKKLRDMEAEAKRRNDARRQQTRPRSHDYDRGR